MSLKTVGYKLVEMCNQGKNFDLMRTMYAPDIVSVEANGEATKGQVAVIHKSEVWAANNTVQSQKVRGPFFNGPNQFAATFTLEVTRKATGKPFTVEEVAIYTVEDDKISHEQFYYDGEH